MKKLMIAFAAVAMAACAQAAAVEWATGAMYDHNDALIKSSSAYVATIYFYSDAAGTTDISSTFGTKDANLTATTSSKKGVYQNTTVNSGIASGDYYAKIVVANSEWSITSEIGKFTYDASAQSNMTIDFGDGTNLGGSTLWDFSGPNNGWVAAPEPTSGMLLLLGMSALALRRKQKKA